MFTNRFSVVETAIIILVLCGTILKAQVQKIGNLTTHIDSIITNMPYAVGGNDYQHPGSNELDTWGEVIDSMLATNYSQALTAASSIDYRIVEFTDNSVSPSKVYYILENNPAGTNYWGTFVLNPAPKRSKIVIESPHPKKDYNTGKQGFYIFKQSGARALYVSGTSRCSSTDSTLCDGKSSVCSGSSEAYRISDQAHTSDGTLQKTTERLLAANSASIFIQPHGFEKQVTDPDVIMSNGVQNDTPPTDYLLTLKTNLLAEDNSLTFKIAHIDLAWDRLLGTTNTQGRLINGSGDPCDISASDNTGQFLHLEQAKVKLRETQADWDKVANAVIATFTADVLPVELVSFTAELNEDNIILNWQTVTEVNNYGFEVVRQNTEDSSKESGDEWETIGFLEGHGNSNSPKYYQFIDYAPPEGKVYYRLQQIDTDGSREYFETLTVLNNTVTGLYANDFSDMLPNEYKLYQNYPNPFNPTTTIDFSIPETAVVSLKIYNSSGEEIKTLVNQKLAAGYHSVFLDATSLASGIYLYKFSAGHNVYVKKMLLIK